MDCWLLAAAVSAVPSLFEQLSMLSGRSTGSADILTDVAAEIMFALVAEGDIVATGGTG